MIDIVVTYVNESDEKWQKEFNYYKDKEIKEGKTSKDNRQAFGKERTRNWGEAFKYWFRGIEKNCSWINKVFLIVQNENHVPKWINKDNPKLRIVYHEEYIPKELLPTFNAMPIGMYTANIKELSETYIIADDDYYFINPIKEDHFFKYGKPIAKNNQIEYKLYDGEQLKGSDKVWFHILNNNLKFEDKFNKKVKYAIYHLPAPRLKSFEQKILKDYGEEIKNSFINSKFRSKDNLCGNMFDDLLKICNKALLGDPYKNSSYRALKSDIDFNCYLNKDMVCFNDTEQLDDYEKTKSKLIEFLDKKLPNKSSFER